MTKNKLDRVILFVIICFGSLLRFWQLDKFPVSLNWDEVSHGYNAYSILKTGRDEWGVAFPLIFRAFGDFKLPLYIYASILPVAIFGLNAFAVRFVSALAGSLAILGIYLLTNELFPKSQISNIKYKITIGHLAAFLLSISPWHFFISRPALEANLALTFVIFGFYFLIKGLTSSRYYMPASIFLSLSLHTYNAARVFVPLLIFATFIIFKSKLRLNRHAVISSLVFFSSFLIVLQQVKTGEGIARYQKLAILSPVKVFQIGESRRNSKLTPILARLVHNRPVFFTKTFITNYLGYFSPNFFTQSKGVQSQFAIPGESLVTVSVGFLFFVGLFVCVKKRKNDSSFLLIFLWLLLAPVAAATTFGPPQALRPNPMIPAIIIIAAVGLFSVFSSSGKKLAAVFIFMSILESSVYLANYFGTYANTFSQSWQYGYKQIFESLSQYKDKTIIITKKQGEPHIFYAFYNYLDPGVIQDSNHSLRFKQSEWFWTDKIDNVYFVNDWDIPTTSADFIPLESGGSVSTQDAYLVTSAQRIPTNASPTKAINYLDGTPAFVITKF